MPGPQNNKIGGCGTTVVTLALLAFLLLPQDSPAEETADDGVPRSFAALVEKSAPAVINIYARKIVRSRTQSLDGSAFWRLFRDTLLFGYGRERIENSLGSGVMVRSDGVIVTNHHVVEAADGIVAALADGRVFNAEVLLSDKRTDLAVLKIATRGETLPSLEFGDSDLVRVGDPVLVIGNPFGLGQTVTSGIVSALARTSVGISDFRFFIQTDAAINPGNSGGAQIAMDGKLIGISTAIYSTTGGSQGLGFAIPANMVRMVVETAVQRRPLIRPWIGLSGRPVPAQAATMLGLPAKGVLVTGLYKEGPAAAAGIATGDIVLSVDGLAVDDPQVLRYRIATRLVGTNARLRLIRRGAPIEILVALKAPPDVPPRNDRWLSGLSPLSGAEAASLSPALAEEIGVDSGISGVVLLNVNAGSAAGRLGLRAGDIIRAINGRPISTVEELAGFRMEAFAPWAIGLNRFGQELTIGSR
ncbi:trypsin-like peptidase domain-containing protein [Taklimakanibacter lacteus]|uniref:trypsin-like peptidase domain-containing protein n=1 Tax=Taklimakanibacter lacteus TaxID=2268456 RepID=UPI000E6760C5